MLNKFINKELILYALIGFSGLFLDLLTFGLLSGKFEWNYQWSNWISTSLGITNNFLLNTYFNFRKKDRLLTRFVKFYIVGCSGLALTALILYVGVEILHGAPFIVKSASIIIVFIMQYSLNKRFSFN